MDEPSMSELEMKYNDLLWQINNLELAAPAPSPPPGPDGDFIPAGTIVTCRPSRAAAMIKRLGGEENVEIVDTAETEGFARGRHKDAAPWTNLVYPYDIGPSCGGRHPEDVLISSDTARVSAPPVNNCITADSWNTALMFDAGRGVSPNDGEAGWIEGELTTIARILYLSDMSDVTPFGFMFRFRADGLFGYGGPLDPYTQASPNIYPRRIYHVTRTFSGFFNMSSANRAQWKRVYGEDFPLIDLPMIEDYENDTIDFDTDETFMWDVGYGAEIKIVDPNALYIVVDDSKTTHDYVMTSFFTRDFGFPYKLSIFSIEANTIDMASPTPTITYGGYDRKNPPGTGPAPKWNRTNLVQLKILRDVTIEM